MRISSIEQHTDAFRVHGVSTIYLKHLFRKQNNEKSQMYLGGGLDGVTNLFLATIDVRSPSESTCKLHCSAGESKLEARLDLA